MIATIDEMATNANQTLAKQPPTALTFKRN
jgi:hypothetical protein